MSRRGRSRTRTATGAGLAVAMTTAALGAVGTVGAVTVGTAVTAQAAAVGCTADHEVTARWGSGFTAVVTITNHGDALDGWTLRWRSPGGQEVVQLWNGTVRQAGPDVTVDDAGYNARLATGQSTTIGFVGRGPAGVEPSSFSLNGTHCSGDIVDPEPDPAPEPEPTPDPQPGPEDPDRDREPAPAPSGTFYVAPGTQADAAASRASGETRRLLEKISTTPQAHWVGDWDAGSTAASRVADYTRRASDAGATGVLAVYAIPYRDCGSYAAGGVAESEYAAWVDQVADAIVGNPWVILEPDALGHLGSCPQGDRIGFLTYAARSLSEAGARVYLDIGHSGWLSAEEAARRLELVGFEHAHGFALNTSNYQTTAAETAYGERVSALVGGRGFVIDTSRNGNGSDGTWCNPRGRALGERPRMVEGSGNLEALLWVKLPGESDGTCNGGPTAGHWFQDIALEMARNASW